MTRTTATNFSGALQFPMADAGTDIFVKEDVQTLAKAVDGHDHTTGKGLALAAGSIPNGTITSAMIADGTIVEGDLADGAVTSAKILDGTIGAGDLAAGAVTNAKLAADTARANLLTNGGFEIWQRGNGPFTTNGAFTADRWGISLGAGAVMSVSRDGTTIDSVGAGQYAAAATYTHGSAETALWQPLSNESTHLRGRTITASVRVRTSTANAVRLALYDGAFTYGTYHTGDGAWQTLTVTKAISAGSGCDLRVIFNASCTAYIDNAMLVMGSVPADYAPLHPADDLARCLRYYETIGKAYGLPMIQGYQSAGGVIFNMITFAAKKSVVPTVTKVGTFNVVNSNQPTNLGVGVDGFVAQITATATGYAYADGTGAEYYSAEGNP